MSGHSGFNASSQNSLYTKGVPAQRGNGKLNH